MCFAGFVSFVEGYLSPLCELAMIKTANVLLLLIVDMIKFNVQTYINNA